MKKEKGGRWRSFSQAIKSKWSGQKIDAMSKRLEAFRSELVFRMLVLLNAKEDSNSAHQDENFERLHKKHDDIVEVVSINQEMLRSTLRDNTTDLTRLLQKSSLTARQRHDETIAAILTLKNGRTKVLSRKPNSIPSYRQPSDRTRETLLTLKSASDVLGSPQAGVESFTPVQEKILNCLYFRQISDRIETVAEVHRNTCKWIYSDPEATQKPWSNFAEWLRQGQGCYWINGKAGSGKSTLMKFIHHDPRTKSALSTWASGHELVTASFFFWNLGSTLQKSQGGLLRSLLHDILDRHRHLIATVFPELCRAVTKLNRGEQLSDPSLPELIKGFRRLVRKQATPLRICLLIDGIDEYEGDHSELSELLSSVSSSTHVKIIISSRPIPACVDAFSLCPSLRLQDLTHDDIQLYVEDKLKAKLDKSGRLETADIIAELVEKASGVFIWVVLAVRSLLNGLRNHDRIEDLRRRLDELPADLKELYSHMVRRMPPIYRQQASQLFQLVLRSIQVQPEDSITALQLSFAEDTADYALARPIEAITPKEESDRAEEVEGRVRSRCCGLLEMQDVKTQRRLHSSVIRPQIGFLHKTVVEFLRDPQAWEDMLRLTAGTEFDPTITLLRSCLLLTKTFAISMTIKTEISPTWQSMENCLAYSALAEGICHGWLPSYLDELDRTMTHHWNSASAFSTGAKSCEMNGHWATGLSLTENSWYIRFSPYSLLSLAVVLGLGSYVEEEISRDYVEDEAQLLKIALECFIQSWDDAPAVPWKPHQQPMSLKYAKIVVFLLQNGANPNQKERSSETTTWELALGHLAKISGNAHGFIQDFQKHGLSEVFVKLLACLITSGADPNAEVVDAPKPKSTHRNQRYKRYGEESPMRRRSALEVIQQLPVQEDNHDFSSFTLHRPTPIPALEECRDHLVRLLIERGAESREGDFGGTVPGSQDKDLGILPKQPGPRLDSPAGKQGRSGNSSPNRLLYTSGRDSVLGPGREYTSAAYGYPHLPSSGSKLPAPRTFNNMSGEWSGRPPQRGSQRSAPFDNSNS